MHWRRRRQKTSWLILDQQGELVFKGGGVNPLCRLQAWSSRLLGFLAEARHVRHERTNGRSCILSLREVSVKTGDLNLYTHEGSRRLLSRGDHAFFFLFAII